MKRLIIVIFLILAIKFSSGQEHFKYIPDSIKLENIMRCIVIDGDTVPHRFMREIIIFPPRVFKNKRQYRRYTRLVRYVKKVYPYSQIIKNMLVEIEHDLDSIPTERARKAYVKRKEKALKAEFEGQLRKLTFTQGRILIKLIDRETGQTTYELVKQLKGSLSAFFWQSVAVVFSSSLKYEYDAKGDDQMIEEIVVQIENGLL